MSAWWRIVEYGLLSFAAGCSSATGEAHCDAATTQKLEVSQAVSASLHNLADELSTALYSACLVLARDATAVEPTRPSDVDTLVEVCDRASRALRESIDAGTQVTANPARCLAPTSDNVCLLACTEDVECKSLCNAKAALEVSCDNPTVVVTAGDTPSIYEQHLPAVLCSYARARIASEASSTYVDVTQRLVSNGEDCTDLVLARYWDDVIMIQAILVMSAEIAGQVTGFSL